VIERLFSLRDSTLNHAWNLVVSDVFVWRGEEAELRKRFEDDYLDADGAHQELFFRMRPARDGRGGMIATMCVRWRQYRRT
jgi:hypothetical protein